MKASELLRFVCEDLRQIDQTSDEYQKTMFKLKPHTYFALDGIHESTRIAGDGPSALKLSDFIATPVLIVAGQIITIGDVISHSANVLGGVHFGIPMSNEELALSAANDNVTAFGLPISAHQLKPIVRVVLDDLEELYDACA